MTRRTKEFSTAVRKMAYGRSLGFCEQCGEPLEYGNYRYDHIIPIGIGGDSTIGNCQVICMACDGKKTPGDQTRIAKTKRMSAKHDGTYRPSRHPMRHPTLRKTLSGKVVER